MRISSNFFAENVNLEAPRIWKKSLEKIETVA